MNRVASVVVSVLLFLCCSGGESDKKQTRFDKLVTIAVLEDSRNIGRGELIDYLEDSDPEIRARSVTALARIAWPGTAEQVGRLITDSVETVRLHAAFALSQLADSSGIFPIATNLKNEKSAEVRCAMIEALGRIGNPVVVSTLVANASDPDPAIRGAVALALSDLPGHGRISGLLELSRDSVGDVRWKAVYALSRSADSSALGRLRWCLKDSVSLVRQFAARAIAAMADSAGLKHLTNRLRHEVDDLVRINLIRAIAAVGDKKALKSLLNVLSGKHRSHVKAEAIAAIGALRLDKAFAKLVPFLEDENRIVRGNAIAAVARVNPDFFMQNLSGYRQGADWHVMSRLLDGLSAVGTPSAFEAAVELFSHEDPRVRRRALEALVTFEDLDVRTHLESALDDPDFTVAATAVNAIASRGDTAFAAKMAEMYSRHRTDKEPNLRFALVEAFAEWLDSSSSDPVMLDVLDYALDDTDYHIRKAAIGGFRKIGVDHTAELGAFNTDITAETYDDVFDRFSRNPTAVIATNRGSIKLELLYHLAPKTVSNFVDLAQSGFYDQRIWHRVIPAFVIQGGCPRGDSWGGPGYTIRCEYSREPFVRGSVGMAHSGKDTGGSQFFIAHTALPHLKSRYTAFARVVSGMRVVDRIELGDSIRTIEVMSNDATR
jgi:cyclophilin family peptidyl-prolyl cis-trans isomerase/HEAT repeat protein